MELDHIFFFVDDPNGAIGKMEALGFAETYRREHPGQGTTNCCYAFDNIYLELLWVVSKEEVASEVIRRTRLAERAGWKSNVACPFGFSWRNAEPEALKDIPIWPYTPPYLPEGINIPVAEVSDDPVQPMFFQTPGGVPPINWPEERRGNLQHAAGYGKVARVYLQAPCQIELKTETLKLCGLLDVELSSGKSWGLQLEIEQVAGGSSILEIPTLKLQTC